MQGDSSLIRRVRRPLVKIARVVLRKERARRDYTPFADDICLVAYPKSGNTWLRFLVGNLLHPDHPVTFANIESFAPSIYENPDRNLQRAPRPRILKSHEPFFARHGRVIYIVRDPRDIAVSYYHYLIKFRELPEGYPMEQYVPRFIEADFESEYGPWHDHVLSWTRMRDGHPGFHLLRYEDLLGNTAHELGGIAAFLNLPADADRVERAIALSSPDRMRNLEKRESREWSATRNSRQDMPFVRSARSGDWRRDLPEESVRQIEAAWGPVMAALGYDLVTVPEETLTPASLR
jgi:estrone sulfotransferase